MLTIPSGDAARQAWAALPEGVRAEVKQYADRYEGHHDPAVAAVAVGHIRAGVDLQWYRVVAAVAGLALFAGAAVAALGDSDAKNGYIIFGGGAFGLIVTGAAMHWPHRYVINRAEVANLNVFLDSPDAGVEADPPPPQNRPWQRITVVSLALALGVAAVAYAQIRLMYLTFDLPALARHAAFWAGMLALVNRVQWVLPRLDPRKSRAHRVSAGEDGLRFNRRRPVPWADVLGVALHGPTQSDPDRKSEMVWSLRDHPDVVVPLHGSRRPPEELIMAARSYMAFAW